ncbi:MAG TPA: hypothetical protein DCF48_05715 [Rikenellaceae bacterium]|nr:hypothetical protein [Rikenellaceae bacterium]
MLRDLPVKKLAKLSKFFGFAKFYFRASSRAAQCSGVMRLALRRHIPLAPAFREFFTAVPISEGVRPPSLG